MSSMRKFDIPSGTIQGDGGILEMPASAPSSVGDVIKVKTISPLVAEYGSVTGATADKVSINGTEYDLSSAEPDIGEDSNRIGKLWGTELDLQTSSAQVANFERTSASNAAARFANTSEEVFAGISADGHFSVGITANLSSSGNPLLTIKPIGSSDGFTGIKQYDPRTSLDVNGTTTSHAYQLYADYTSASDYERLRAYWDSGNSRYVIASEVNGTGSHRDLMIDFGSVKTDGIITISSTSPQLRLEETDSGDIWRHFISSSDYYIEPQTTDGQFRIRNLGGANIFEVDTTNGNADVSGDLDVGGSLDITGSADFGGSIDASRYVPNYDGENNPDPSDTPSDFYFGFVSNDSGGNYPSSYGSLFGFTNSSNAYGYSYQLFKASSGNELYYRYADSSAWQDWEWIHTTGTAIKTSNVLQIDGTGDSYVLGDLGVGRASPRIEKLDVDGQMRADAYRLYADYTSSSDYERLRLYYDTGDDQYTFTSETAGTGVDHPIDFNMPVGISGNAAQGVGNTAVGSLVIESDAVTAGDGNYGTGISFMALGASVGGGQRAGIVPVQTGVDADRVGLAFLTHDSASGGADLVETLKISHGGTMTLLSNGNAEFEIKGDDYATLYISADEGLHGVRDATIRYLVQNTERWRVGVDQDDGHKYKIATGSLGSNSVFTADGANTRIGIGRDDPQEALHLYDSSGSVRLEVESGGGSAIYKVTSPSASYGMYAHGSENKLVWYDYGGANQLITIDSSGNLKVNTDGTDAREPLDVVGNAVLDGKVGIGKVAGSERLELSGGASRCLILFSGSNITNDWYVGPKTDDKFYIQEGSSTFPFVSDGTTNTVGIFKTDPRTELDVAGTVTADDYQLYADYTSSSDYERLRIYWDSGNSRYTIESEHAGTGVQREIAISGHLELNNRLGVGGATIDTQITVAGTNSVDGIHLKPQADNDDFSGRVFFTTDDATNGGTNAVLRYNNEFAITTGATIGVTSGTARLIISDDGDVDIGQGITAGWVVIGSGTTTQAPLKMTSGTNLTTPESGAIEYDGDSFLMTVASDRKIVTLSDGTITSDTTVNNTITETTVYTESISANDLHVGQMVTVRVNGIYSTANGTDTFTLRFKFGGTEVDSFTSTAANVTDGPFEIEFVGTIRSVGGTGSIMTAAKGFFNNELKQSGNTSATTVDTTSAGDITVTIAWSAADASNSVTVQQGLARFDG